MHQLSLNEAQANLPSLVNEAIGGEAVYIVNADQRIVQLVPVPTAARPRFGSARGLITLAEDFDAPLEDFREYME